MTATHTRRSPSPADVDDYEDVVLVSQKVHMTHCEVMTQTSVTQERNFDNQETRETRQDEQETQQPPMQAPSPDHSSQQNHVPPKPLQKPVAKPRRKKKMSESTYPSGSFDSNQTSRDSSLKRSLSIPRQPSSNFPPSALHSSTSNFTLNSFCSQESYSQTTTRTELRHPHSSTVHTPCDTSTAATTQRVLTHAPLTPPLPKPRSGARSVRFAKCPPHTDSGRMMGRNGGLPVATQNYRLTDMPVTDV